VIRKHRQCTDAASPRSTLLLLLSLAVVTWGTHAAAQTTTFVFDLKASGPYNVFKNGSTLVSAYASPQGVLRFTDPSAPNDLILVAEDSTAAAVVLSGFEAGADGEAVNLTWDVFSDEPLRGFVLYRCERAEPGRGAPVHEQPFLPPGARSHIDRTVAPATWYRYTLIVVREDGSEAAWLSRDVQTGQAWLELGQNAPNPFNPQTSISFVLPATAVVRLEVFDVEGRRVATLVDATMPAGRHRVLWDGTDRDRRPVATGTYFYRLTAGKRSLSRKMLLLK
jgi:hypothetical protein